MLRIGIDPEKLYRATFICQDGPCCSNPMALISFRLFRKSLGNLRDVFGQVVYPPPPGKKCPARLCLMGYTKGNSYELTLNNLDVYRSQIVPHSWSLGTVTGDYSYTLGEKRFSNEKEPRLAI